MGDRPRKPLFPNPFYLALLIVSTLFVMTTLAYVVSPWVGAEAAGVGQPAKPPGAASLALADWLDRRGPLVLGVEFVLMLIFGLLAMATDHWFATSRNKKRTGSGLR